MIESLTNVTFDTVYVSSLDSDFLTIWYNGEYVGLYEPYRASEREDLLSTYGHPQDD